MSITDSILQTFMPEKQYAGQAISYIRFSTKSQADGHSLKRQTSSFENWCITNNMQILDTYQDLGISSFKGENIEGGAMGKLLQHIECGNVAVGTYLVVESLDRISRADIDTQYDIFRDILRSGINIVSLADAGDDGEAVIHYGKGSPHEIKDPMQKMISIIVTLSIFVRANNESAIKQTRASANWRKRHEEAKKSKKALSKVAPAWLRKVGEYYEVDEKRKKTMLMIFDLYKDGLGYQGVADKLNRDGVTFFTSFTHTKPRTDKWSASRIKSIIGNEAVYGWHAGLECDLYPPIMDKEEYVAIISKRRKLSPLGGENKKFKNIFRNVAKCPCGKNLVHRGGASERAYLFCLDCKTQGVYDYCLDLICGAFGDDIGLALYTNSSEIREIKKRNILRQYEIDGYQSKVDRITKRIINDDASLLDTFTDAIMGLKAEIRKLENEMEDSTYREKKHYVEATDKVGWTRSMLSRTSDDEESEAVLRQFRIDINGVLQQLFPEKITFEHYKDKNKYKSKGVRIHAKDIWGYMDYATLRTRYYQGQPREDVWEYLLQSKDTWSFDDRKPVVQRP